MPRRNNGKILDCLEDLVLSVCPSVQEMCRVIRRTYENTIS